MRTKCWISLLTLAVALALPLSSAHAAEASEEVQGTVNVGDKVPDFTLKDQNGDEQSLESLLAQDGALALFFFRSASW